MKLFRITALALVVVALLAVGVFAAACGGEEETTTTVAPETTTTAAPSTDTTATTTAPSKITKIGIITPEEAKDFGWNQQGVQSAQNVADARGIPIDIADGSGYGDIAPIQRELAQGGDSLIFAFASGYNTVAPNVAKETGVPVVVIGGLEAGNVPGVSQDIETYAQDGAYLAGILAAKMTKSKSVGIVISADDENWIKMSAGFAAGVVATDPAVKILFAQVGQAAYADAAAAKRTTEQIIAGGADIVFGMGDGSSFGMIQAVETATPPAGADKVWFIDVIGDKTSLDKKGVLLSSQIWDYTPAFTAAADALDAGTFGNEIIYIDLKNDGIGIMKTQYIPDDVWAEIETAKAAIIDGTIKVPIITSKAEVEAIIKGQ